MRNAQTERLESFLPLVEPANLQDAIRRVESDHYYTGVTLDTHRSKQKDRNFCGVTGGYGETYSLLANNGFFASLFPKELVREGLALVETRQKLESEAEEAVMRTKYKTRLGKRKLVEVLAKWNEYSQDEACRDAEQAFTTDPRSVTHFETQFAYEEKLIGYLKSLETARAVPHPKIVLH